VFLDRSFETKVTLTLALRRLRSHDTFRMRRILRWCGRAALAVIGLAVLLAVTTLTTVDSTPFAQTDYYASTLRALDDQERTGFATGALRAGFGKARLTPTLGVAAEVPTEGRFRQIPLAGYGSRRGTPASGVHDDVFVRSVAFEVAGQRLLMLSADALIVPREVAEETARQLQERFGLPRESLYFGATHTHASLGGWGRGPVGEAFAGPFNPGTLEWFARQLTAAAQSALDDLTPAALGQRSFLAPEHVRNRLVGDDGPVNPKFDCLWIRQADGDHAVIGSYAAHATVLPASVMEFSGGYPGAWARALETDQVKLAVFFAGTMASHSPVAGARGFEGAELLGHKLATGTIGTLASTVLTNRIGLGVTAVPVSLPPLQPRLSERICLRPWVAGRLLPVQSSTWLQVVQFGQHQWVATPCDFSGELADTLAPELAPEGFAPVFTSFNGDYVGYVIPSRYYGLPGYESRTMAFYGPHFGDYLSDMILRLANRLTNSPE